VFSAGTGGTIAGISTYLKEQNPDIQICLIDPPGSGLYNLLEKGTMFDPQDAMIVQPLEPRSIYEGIGINRQTENLMHSKIDEVYSGTDLEGVEMAHYLLRKEGLFVGGSTALNFVGAVRLARKLGPGNTIVTIISDSGQRYQSKMYNDNWLEESNLVPTHSDLSFIV